MAERDGIADFGDALVAAVRREELAELPALAAFGVQLVASARRAERRRSRLRSLTLGALVALPIAATSGAATALVLRETVISPPDPAQVAREQTPLAGTARVSALRAADPGGGLPWTLRVARSQAGFTCTTVGQVRDAVFGLTGLDGVFRRLPGELSDACGHGGTLTGARVVDGRRPADVRTIVYGVAGDGLRAATLRTATSDRALPVGPGGTFVATLRGYPEDHAAGIALRFADGRTETHDFAGAPGTVVDPAGRQAWTVERYLPLPRHRCAHVRPARPDGASTVSPTACLALDASKRSWVADARRLRPGDGGTPGPDRWDWGGAPARTVVWGMARDGATLRSVTLLGAGGPRRVALATDGGFAAVLPISVDPSQLTLEVHLADGRVERGRPGEGLALDPAPQRRPR